MSIPLPQGPAGHGRSAAGTRALPERVRPLPAYVELLVVGGGASGLSAAIEAVTTGGLDPADVLLVDAQPALGGAAVVAGGGICIAGTPLQARKGIEDSVELAYQDWLSAGGDLVDTGWARRYLEAGNREVYGWLEQLGLHWTEVSWREGNSVPRWHRAVGGGKAVAACLVGHLGRLGVRAALEAEVTGLVLAGGPDGGGRPGGELSAVTVRWGGSEHTVGCGAAIVATGGFVNNPDTVRTHTGLPEDTRFLSGGAPHADGRGHRLLADAGAQFTAMGEVWFYPFGTPNYRLSGGTSARGLAVRGLGNAIWVNRRGERFHNEALSGGGSGGRAIFRQPGQTCWAVFDADEVRTLLLRGDRYYASGDDVDRDRTAEFLRESPYAATGDTVCEAADRAGLPGRAVEATVAAFNARIAEGAAHDPAFGRPLAGLREIARGPFHVVQFFPLAQKNLGGVHTDEVCAVRRADGSTITGLFASGEVAGMGGGHINGHGAIEGTMLGPCLYSGRVAGSAAAAAVRARREPAG